MRRARELEPDDDQDDVARIPPARLRAPVPRRALPVARDPRTAPATERRLELLESAIGWRVRIALADGCVHSGELLRIDKRRAVIQPPGGGRPIAVALRGVREIVLVGR